MTSHKTTSKRRDLFKTKGPNWKELVRAQKLRRLQSARSKLIENARQSVIKDIQLEDDLQLEQDLLGEELEQEYNHLYDEFSAVDRPCPICGQELKTTQDFRACAVECEICDFSTNQDWKNFQQCLNMALRQHSERGCVRQAEFISLEGDLFIACDVCDHLEAAS